MNKIVINHLVKTNDKNYNIDKAVEELSELSTALLQYKLKSYKHGMLQNIIDEIGDVKIRLKILEQTFGKKKVKNRIKYKINKYKTYISENKYQGKI